MRKILIVGAGQCGLTLAHGLLQAGDYDVTIFSARTPDEIRASRPTSTQVMFGPALAIERRYGLDLWADEAPRIAGLHMTVAVPGGRLDLYGALDAPAQSTDQRVKMAMLLDLIRDRGGTVHILGVSTRDLDDIAASGRFDLIIVAAGRGDLAALFDRDPDRSPYTTPQRALAACYVHGMRRDPDTDLWPNVTFTSLPGAGELILIPALTLTGPCDILFWEVVPGGPLDVFGDHPQPSATLARAIGLVKEHVPWLYPRCSQLQLTDARAAVSGRYVPTVRRPVGRLPSGAVVLGAADVVIANDPVTAQGANTAAKCAAAYLDAIITHGDRPFDPAWMQETFDTFWARTAAAATNWTNAMLGPPPEHVQRLLGAATQWPEVANRLANAFADPNDLANWFVTPEVADRYLSDVLANARTSTHH
jgi:2-polyprenyl-6-methoxyphenol hydroxylase-like FAD-dependent oxidoreductase